MQAIDTPDLRQIESVPAESARPHRGPDLIAHLLQQQQQLTAVDQFSRQLDAAVAPAQAKYYAKLLPAAPPGPGQQYAFEVDLDRCSGCKACVTACHTLNGLDEQETWRDVGLLIGGSATNPVMQHVTTSCHHCLEPACMTACPVDAYEKDPATGIVKHLDDQCFGCQYCTLACPYDVPKYHREKGIVRKCDMCSSRLAAGEAPACAQACPHQAIAIRVVDERQVVEDSEANHFLPAAPEPNITLPTTTYKTSRAFPRNVLPVDYHATSPQSPHWPLIGMLVLTQLSVGAFTLGIVLEWLQSGPVATFQSLQATSALVFGLLAIGASVFHLGRPRYAYRAMIGLRHSWLSREILAFGVFAGLACLYAVSSWTVAKQTTQHMLLGWTVAASGISGLFCSIMIYAFTQREFWSLANTGIKFVLTAIVLGIAATWLTILGLVGSSARLSIDMDIGALLARALLVATSAKLIYEATLFRHLTNKRNSPLKRSANLMLGTLSSYTLARLACGLLGGIVMPLILIARRDELMSGANDTVLLVCVAMLFVACLVGELLERYLFFAAVAVPRMPGGLRS